MDDNPGLGNFWLWSFKDSSLQFFFYYFPPFEFIELFYYNKWIIKELFQFCKITCANIAHFNGLCTVFFFFLIWEMTQLGRSTTYAVIMVIQDSLRYFKYIVNMDRFYMKKKVNKVNRVGNSDWGSWPAVGGFSWHRLYNDKLLREFLIFCFRIQDDSSTADTRATIKDSKWT